MTYLCLSGRHRHRTEKQADACRKCRRVLDAKVRAHFKRESERMLKRVGG